VGSSLQEERHVRSAWELIKKTTAEIIHEKVVVD
jgi:tyrosine decarboxylase